MAGVAAQRRRIGSGRGDRRHCDSGGHGRGSQLLVPRPWALDVSHQTERGRAGGCRLIGALVDAFGHDISHDTVYEVLYDVPGWPMSFHPPSPLNHQSHSYLREFDLPIDTVRGYTESSLNLTHCWSVDAYANNIENRVVRNGGIAAVGVYFSGCNPPRTHWVRIAFKYQHLKCSLAVD
jgi:hypothetical protein